MPSPIIDLRARFSTKWRCNWIGCDLIFETRAEASKHEIRHYYDRLPFEFQDVETEKEKMGGVKFGF